MIDVLLEAITDDLLGTDFGAPTLARARPYARRSAMSGLEVDSEDLDGFEARARVSGSDPTPYAVVLVLSLSTATGRAQLRSTCSCPVRFQCKHGAALALVLRGDRGAARVPTWEDHLAGALAHADQVGGAEEPDEEPAGPRQLALQLHLTLPPEPGARRTSTLAAGVRMRPMRQGARRTWIKSGASWPDLRSGTGLGGHDPDQVDALRQLSALLAGRGPGARVERPYLQEFGEPVWRLLHHALDVGVALQLSRPLVGLELLDDPVDLALDLVRDEQGVGVRAGVDTEDGWFGGRQVLTVGQPAHGVVLLREVPGRSLKGPQPHEVVLAPLTRPAPVAVVGLLRRDDPVLVPPADWTRFEADQLPRLRQGFVVGSSDASVALPAAVLPRLQLTVTWTSAVRADLGWAWRYDEPARTRTCALDSTDRLGGTRDRGAERVLLGRLASQHDLGVLGVSRTATGAPAATSTVEGPDALALAEEVLPALREGDLVDVVEVDPPDFREAQGAPEISFDVRADADDPGPTDWLDLQVAIAVDGEDVPLPLVLSALTLGLPRIVLPSGLHLPSDSPELLGLRDLVDSAGQVRERDRDGVSVGTHDLGLWAQLAELGVVDTQAAEWVRRAQALRDLVTLPSPEPVGVVSTLRSYQLEGFRWLAFLQEHGLGGILADDMGLGKTLQVLAMISLARSRGAGPFLVVAPTSVVSAWDSETARHTPGLRMRAVTSSATRRTSSIAELAADADLVVTTYTLLRLESEAYEAVTWGGLVLDEAQQVKNHQAKTYQAVRRIGAPFTLAVTGTPFENRLMELWSLLSITVPGLYPWPQAFLDQVAVPVEKEGDAGALRRFRARIRPFLLRRTKELVAADLPPKQEQVLAVHLDPAHRRLYDTHLQRERQRVLGLVDDFASNRVAIFSSLTRLRQLSLAAALVDPDQAGAGSAKIDTLVEHLREVVAEGHRALVFSQFTSFLALVRERLQSEGIAASYLDGSTTHRGRVVSGFKDGDDPVFLISLKAGGVGLTLTEADYVFVLDPWWNPASEAQAVDRAHRIGQARPVMVYRLVSVGTIEEKVMALKARKAALFSQVVDGEGGFGADITADDIRGLFD